MNKLIRTNQESNLYNNLPQSLTEILRKTMKLRPHSRPQVMRKVLLGGMIFFTVNCAQKSSSNLAGGTAQKRGLQLIRSHYSPGEVSQLCQGSIQRAQLRLDQIAQVSSREGLLEFEKVLSDFSDEVTPLTFMGYVSENEKVAEEASKCESDVGQFSVSIYTRRDLYEKIRQFSKPAVPSSPHSSPQLSLAEKRLLKETLEEFERNGLKLADTELMKVRELKSKLTVLETEFSTNLNKDQSQILATEEELKGVPVDYVKSLKKSPEGLLIVPMTEADYPIVMQNASSEELRKRVFNSYFTRGGTKNLELIEKAVQLRREIAQLLGFKNWADFRTQKRMAGSREKVLKFLTSLKRQLREGNRKDFQELLRVKQEQDPKAKELFQWDVTYYNYQMKKRDFKIDNEKIREYFPADTVIHGMFKIYSEMLGLQFRQVKEAVTWSQDVQLYEIQDQKSQQVIGYFYTDFYPRKGKYDHAAAFPLVVGREQSGAYVKPVSAIVANLTPGMNGKPSLLDHSDVVTMFHEFGHIMHQTLTKAPYASLAGTAVAQDFVEAPSQMLENWAWSPLVLRDISGHYLRPQEKLPENLLKQMIRARDFHQAIGYTKQLLYGLFDMSIHDTNSQKNVNEVYLDLYREVVGQQPAAGTLFPASFGHLMGGYDAGYYGYLWSEVFAADMFSTFPKSKLEDSRRGLLYRREILEKGNMEEADVLLTKFLGRQPNSKAFFKKLGIR